MIEKRGKTSESRKVVKWTADDAMEWMRRSPHAKFENYLVRTPIFENYIVRTTSLRTTL